jgi:hypothetical protein
LKQPAKQGVAKNFREATMLFLENKPFSHNFAVALAPFGA